jgi:hypothetical protein
MQNNRTLAVHAHVPLPKIRVEKIFSKIDLGEYEPFPCQQVLNTVCYF